MLIEHIQNSVQYRAMIKTEQARLKLCDICLHI